MSEFIDEAKRTWTIKINVVVLKRIRELAKIDLLGEQDGRSMVELIAEDPVMLGETLYAICKPQADERDMTDDDFCEVLIGDTLEVASNALIEGIIDFFPKRRGTILSAVHEKTKALQEEAEAAMLEEIQKKTEPGSEGSESDQTTGKSSTNTPDTSE